MLHDGKTKRPSLFVIIAQIVIVVDGSLSVLLQPGLRLLKFRRPGGTKEHGYN